jgi:hypothetical protein
MADFIERLPFELAIKDPKLLKPRFDTLSKPQQVILKAFYGMNLSEEELVFWSIFQGGATYNALYEVTSVVLQPYKPREYTELAAIIGRRGGKTDMVVSTAAAYEITLGGHAKHVKPGQEYKALFLAQTKPDAQQNMNFIKLALEESPLLSKLLVRPSIDSEIRLTNGLIVEPAPANKAVGRGHAIPVAILDESAFWYTDPNASNPDYEVLRAISFSQLQFPNSKLFIPSTPWAEQGIIWKAFQAGTMGRKLQCDVCKANGSFVCEHQTDERDEFENTLVVHASTSAMQNPTISRKKLIAIYNRDKEAYPRESGAQFIKSISGWLNTKNVEAACLNAPDFRERMPRPGHPGDIRPTYVAAMDPAFRNDAFALTIVHHEFQTGIVQDYVKYWEPLPGIPLKPGTILDEIKVILDMYGLDNIYSDQHQLESLQQLAMDRGFQINGYDFTQKSKSLITGSFKVLLDQGRLKLLNHELQKDQLMKLQKKVLQTGNVQIAAPPGRHDDLAMTLMLAARIVMWLFADMPKKATTEPTIETDHVKMGLAQIKRARDQAIAEAESY